jgi:hypothetical protein
MRFTREAAERFFSELTGGSFDSRLFHYGPLERAKKRYVVRWVFKDSHNKWCQYTVVVPEYAPERFEVHGWKHNQGYTSSAMYRREQKEVIRNLAVEVLDRILRDLGTGQEEDDEDEDEYDRDEEGEDAEQHIH